MCYNVMAKSAPGRPKADRHVQRWANHMGYNEKNKHNEATHFRYEVSTWPWFGPWEKAISALQQVSVVPLTEDQYLDYIKSKHPNVYQSIEWVRFHRFKWKGKRKTNLPRSKHFEFRLAVTNLQPVNGVRDYLYSIREQITKDTGWYPVVQGNRAWIHAPPFRKLQKPRRQKSIAKVDLEIGELRGIRDLFPLGGGNSLLLEGTRGNVLLDTGFHVDAKALANVKLVFLSHFHKDHSGGLRTVLSHSRIPVLLSETSLTYLFGLDEVPQAEKEQLAQRSFVLEFCKLGSHSTIKVFPVFHAPGSFGVAISDGIAKSVFYLGDACLRNGFHDSKGQILKYLREDTSPHKYVIIDAALVNKGDFGISEEDTPDTVIDEVASSIRKRNVIFVSDGVETLLYSYILTFYKTRQSAGQPVKIVVSDELYSLAQRLLGPLILRDYKYVDPFIYSLVGRHISNFVESHRIYPLSSLHYIDQREGVVAFCMPKEIQANDFLRGRASKADILLLGTLALRRKIPPQVSDTQPRSVLRVASPDWSFHTSPEDLADFSRDLALSGVKTILFHNHPNAIRDFIAEYSLNSEYVRGSASEPIPL